MAEEEKPAFSADDPGNPRPSDLYLHLTARCNPKCVYCYARPLGKKGEDLPWPLAFEALRQARELDINTVLLTGGEPLLHPQALRIAEAAHDLGFRTILLTNGLLVDAGLAEGIARTCDQVTVSLDSADPELHDLHRGPGTHARASAAIARLNAAGVKEVVASGVITRQTQRERYSEFEENCKSIGADRVARHVYILQGDAQDAFLAPDFALLLESMEATLDQAIRCGAVPGDLGEVIWRDRCGAAFGVIAVGADGAVYPCQGLMRPEFQAGQIAEASLTEIHEGSEIFKQIRGITVAEISGCRECSFRFLCNGGCRALAYNACGSLAAQIPKGYREFNRLLAEWKLWAAALRRIGPGGSGAGPPGPAGGGRSRSSPRGSSPPGSASPLPG